MRLDNPPRAASQAYLFIPVYSRHSLPAEQAPHHARTLSLFSLLIVCHHSRLVLHLDSTVRPATRAGVRLSGPAGSGLRAQRVLPPFHAHHAQAGAVIGERDGSYCLRGHWDQGLVGERMADIQSMANVRAWGRSRAERAPPKPLLTPC